MLPKEVFLSHASADGETARLIKKALEAHGIPVWFSVHHLVAGENWQAGIGEALDRCDWLVVILSPAARESMWVRRELEYAFQQPKFDRKVIPFILQPGSYRKLSWLLSGCQHIDLTG